MKQIGSLIVMAQMCLIACMILGLAWRTWRAIVELFAYPTYLGVFFSEFFFGRSRWLNFELPESVGWRLSTDLAAMLCTVFCLHAVILLAQWFTIAGNSVDMASLFTTRLLAGELVPPLSGFVAAVSVLWIWIVGRFIPPSGMAPMKKIETLRVPTILSLIF